MEKTIKLISITFLLLGLSFMDICAQSLPQIYVPRVQDFVISGEGTNEIWNAIDWSQLQEREGESGWKTEFKVAYSDSGIYFLFTCEDEKITATFEKDYEKLWTEDVVEIFLWPDEQYPLYFEYELSPLNYELPLLISRMNGTHKSWGWVPWQYQERKVVHKTSAYGGEKKSGEMIMKWTAELFIPFELLTHFSNTPPGPDTRWRANMYRVDYDNEEEKLWSWSPFRTNFHDYENFGVLIFE